MQDVMGVINLINEEDHLYALTENRCLASVPFGGRYRLIDFMLSNMVNAGISNVSVFVHSKYRSLMDHLGSGKEWDLDRKKDGLYLLTPGNDEMKEIIKGDLYQFYYQREYFYRSKPEYIVLSRSHILCHIDLDEVVAAHRRNGADLTLVYTRNHREQKIFGRKVCLNEAGRVIEMQEHPDRMDSDRYSMEIFVMKKDLFLHLVETNLAKGYDHFVRDAVMKHLDELTVMGYEYRGYYGFVNSLQSYYAESMRLLQPEVWQRLFHDPDLIYTKIKDEPPARYTADADVKKSMIANGCVIEGKVENSILFRGVKVARGCHIRNSILFQNCNIQRNVRLDSVILDKEVEIRRGKVLKGDTAAPLTAVKRQVIF